MKRDKIKTELNNILLAAAFWTVFIVGQLVLLKILE